MKKIVFLISVWVIIFPASSQQYECNCSETDGSYNTYLLNLLISREYQNPISYYGGNQYFNSWTIGRVNLTNGATVNNINLRYNKFLDELLWLRTSDFKTGVVNKSIVKGFMIYDEDNQLQGTFVKKKIKTPGMDSINAYLQILAEGELSLYTYRNVVRAISESRIVDNTSYYIFIDEDRYYTIRLKKRILLNIPEIDSEIMKSIIRTNRITFRGDETNFARAVKLYNEAVER